MANEERETLNRRENILRDLKKPRYRRGFVEGHAKDTIAFQLRALRKQKHWEQRDVAKKLGNEKLQPMISRYENPDYGRYSVSTLLDLATVFDVGLMVRFVPFSELLEWDWSSTAETMCPASFPEDTRFYIIATELRKEGRVAVNQNQGRGMLSIEGHGGAPPNQPKTINSLLEKTPEAPTIPPLNEEGQKGMGKEYAAIGSNTR